MSKLIKKIAKGVKKVFKAIKKVVKKIFSSKIFKAIAIAAVAIVAAPAIAGTLAGGGAAAGASAGAAAASTAATAGASTAAATAGFGAKMMTIAKGSLGAVGSFAKAHPLLASTALTTGGNLLAGYSRAKAEQDAWDKQDAELTRNNRTQLPIQERLAKYSGAPQTSRSQPQARTVTNDPAPVSGRIRGTRQFYDAASDSYKPVRSA